MFHTQQNKGFLIKKVIQLLSDPEIIVKNINPPRPFHFCVAFSKKIKERTRQIVSFVNDEFEDYIPKTRDYYDNKLFSQDEVYRAKYKSELLRKDNRDFVIGIVKSVLESPDSLFEDFYEFNDETGEHEFKEYGYSSASYSDGTWHPEHLFTESLHNKQVSYHQDLNVTTSSDPAATGIGHRYRRNAYEFKGQFPHWQYSVNTRPYAKTDEGLRAGGLSDRRTNRNWAYAYTPDLLARTNPKYNLRSYYVGDLRQYTGYKSLGMPTN